MYPPSLKGFLLIISPCSDEISMVPRDTHSRFLIQNFMTIWLKLATFLAKKNLYPS